MDLVFPVLTNIFASLYAAIKTCCLSGYAIFSNSAGCCLVSDMIGSISGNAMVMN